ncbi:MAG: glycosyltransferase family A protein [Planctomycetota bacterium]
MSIRSSGGHAFVGGYPAVDLGEDALFFKKIHELLDEEHLVAPIEPDDRYFIMRAKSPYAHMSIGGGKRPLNTKPGRHLVEPRPIADPLLRSHYEERCDRRGPSAARSHAETVVARSDGLLEAESKPALSVCVSLKNRSRVTSEHGERALFPNCVSSLAAAAERLRIEDGIGPIELIVADFNSDDHPPAAWLPEAATGLLWTLLRVDGPFCRGRGLNRAITRTAADLVFILEADLLIDRSVLFRAHEVAAAGGVWSGVFQYLSPEGRRENWEGHGYGPIAAARAMIQAAGGVPEFESWGGDDDLFYERLTRLTPATRERLPGLRHQWHPHALRQAFVARPRHADYYDYLAARGTSPSDPRDGTDYFFTRADRANRLLLLDNGRFLVQENDAAKRPRDNDAGRAGRYTLLPQELLVMDWDDRSRNVLRWNADHETYEDAEGQFVVRRQYRSPRRIW